MTTAIPAAELDARFSDPNASATPWERVEHTIDGAELFWISTVRSDGRPHVTPLPAVWVDGSLYFCTGAEEQKCVNLARNANCVLTRGSPGSMSSSKAPLCASPTRSCWSIWRNRGGRSITATGTSRCGVANCATTAAE